MQHALVCFCKKVIHYFVDTQPDKHSPEAASQVSYTQ